MQYQHIALCALGYTLLASYTKASILFTESAESPTRFLPQYVHLQPFLLYAKPISEANRTGAQQTRSTIRRSNPLKWGRLLSPTNFKRPERGESNRLWLHPRTEMLAWLKTKLETDPHLRIVGHLTRENILSVFERSSQAQSQLLTIHFKTLQLLTSRTSCERKLTSNLERSSKPKNYLLNRRFKTVQLHARNRQISPPHPLSSPSPSKWLFSKFLLVSAVGTLSHFGVPRTAWTMINARNRSQLSVNDD